MKKALSRRIATLIRNTISDEQARVDAKALKDNAKAIAMVQSELGGLSPETLAYIHSLAGTTDSKYLGKEEHIYEKTLKVYQTKYRDPNYRFDTEVYDKIVISQMEVEDGSSLVEMVTKNLLDKLSV